MNYQSGFHYGSDAREKPGLVSHALAIQYYGGKNGMVYDFLAGDSRYKRSLAHGGEPLHWAVLHRGWMRRAASHLRELGRKAFFFEKKNQETFVPAPAATSRVIASGLGFSTGN
jgi:CelD/BcsL family acetyltransferase involved in cellulose biosynthesis